MTTILIGTVNGKYICGIDQGAWDSAVNPLGVEVVDSTKQKYLDFDCGIVGRILISGRLDHQCVIHANCIKPVVEELNDEYFAELAPRFDSVEEMGNDLANWLTNASWHNRNTESGSNIRDREIHLCGINVDGSRSAGLLKYDESKFRLEYSELNIDFSPDQTLNMAYLSTPACSPTGYDKGSEEVIGNILYQGRKILPDSHESLLRLNQSLIEIVNNHAEYRASFVHGLSKSELGSIDIVTSIFNAFNLLGLQVQTLYKDKNAFEALGPSGQAQVRNIYNSSAGKPDIRII